MKDSFYSVRHHTLIKYIPDTLINSLKIKMSEEEEESIEYLADKVSSDSHHYFISYLWNLVGDTLKKRKIEIVEEPIEFFDENEDYSFSPEGGLVMRTREYSYYSSNQVTEYYIRNNLFHIIIHRTIHPLTTLQTLPNGTLRKVELDNEEINEYVLTKAFPSLFREGAIILEKEILHTLKSNSIEIDEEDIDYEILIKTIQIDMKSQVENSLEDEGIVMAYLSFDFLFELINLTDFIPPFEKKEGGKEYEKIKRETFIGK